MGIDMVAMGGCILGYAGMGMGGAIIAMARWCVGAMAGGAMCCCCTGGIVGCMLL